MILVVSFTKSILASQSIRLYIQIISDQTTATYINIQITGKISSSML